MIEQNHPYQIGIQSAIPPNVLFWQFELQSPRFPHDLNDIPEIPTIEDEIEEKELESPSSSFPIQSSLQDENNMNLLFDFTNLELDTSFPDLVSGPTSFILQLIFSLCTISYLKICLLAKQSRNMEIVFSSFSSLFYNNYR